MLTIQEYTQLPTTHFSNIVRRQEDEGGRECLYWDQYSLTTFARTYFPEFVDSEDQRTDEFYSMSAQVETLLTTMLSGSNTRLNMIDFTSNLRQIFDGSDIDSISIMLTMKASDGGLVYIPTEVVRTSVENTEEVNLYITYTTDNSSFLSGSGFNNSQNGQHKVADLLTVDEETLENIQAFFENELSTVAWGLIQYNPEVPKSIEFQISVGSASQEITMKVLDQTNPNPANRSAYGYSMSVNATTGNVEIRDAWSTLGEIYDPESFYVPRRTNFNGGFSVEFEEIRSGLWRIDWCQSNSPAGDETNSRGKLTRHLFLPMDIKEEIIATTTPGMLYLSIGDKVQPIPWMNPSVGHKQFLDNWAWYTRVNEG